MKVYLLMFLLGSIVYAQTTSNQLEQNMPVTNPIQMPAQQIQPVQTPAQPVQQPHQAANESRESVFVGLGAVVGPKLQFDNVGYKSDTVNYSGLSLEYDFANMTNLVVGYAEENKDKVGYEFNLQYYPDLQPGNYTLSYKGTSVGGVSSGDSKLSLILPEFLVNYTTNRLVFVGGLSQSVFNYSSSSSTKTEIKGSLGLTLGLKFFIKQNVAVTVNYKSIGASMKMTSGTTVVDTGTGYLRGVSFGLLYYF